MQSSTSSSGNVLMAGTVLAALFAVAAFPQAPDAARPPRAAITRHILQTLEVPGSNYQVVEAKVEIAANSRVPKHTHPGPVVGYVLEGDYSFRLEGQAAKPVPPGQSFVVPSGVPHEEITGAHPATVLAVFTVEKGKPLSSPAP